MRQEYSQGKALSGLPWVITYSARVDRRPEQILIGAGSEYLLMLLSQIKRQKMPWKTPHTSRHNRVLARGISRDSRWLTGINGCATGFPAAARMWPDAFLISIPL